MTADSSDVTRRTALAGTAVAVAAVAGPEAVAQTAPTPSKGPRVWLDFDQAELDRAYDQGVWAPNRDQVVKRYATLSEDTRRHLGEPRRAAYGKGAQEMLDIFRTERASAPINVFIHGGAWRSGQARDYAYSAETFVRAGAHYVSLDFSPVQDVGLSEMVAQVRCAVAWVYNNAASFGGDRDRIYVSGHSSGGHLAGCVVVTDWQKQFGLPANLVKGGMCLSGMYDLKPVRLSARSSYVPFTDQIEDDNSSQRHLEFLNCPVIIGFGALESPEFQRQGREFVAAIQKAGKSAQLIVGPGFNHFEIIETLANPYGLLGRAALAQMKLVA